MIDLVDEEIDLIYNKLIDNKKEVSRKEHQNNLSFFSSTRNILENVLNKLVGGTNEKKRKKIVGEGLTQLNIDIVEVLKHCMVKCEPIICESCAVDIVKDVIKKLDVDNQQYVDKEGLNPARLAQRKDLINIIEVNNEVARNIIKDKTKGSPVSRCDEDKINVWNKLK